MMAGGYTVSEITGLDEKRVRSPVITLPPLAVGAAQAIKIKRAALNLENKEKPLEPEDSNGFGPSAEIRTQGLLNPILW